MANIIMLYPPRHEKGTLPKIVTRPGLELAEQHQMTHSVMVALN